MAGSSATDDAGRESRPADPISTAVGTFGRTVGRKLGRGGNPEDQLRGPLEVLFHNLATHLGLGAVAYGEVQLKEIRARPDYAVDVGPIDAGGVRVGYVEIKAPKHSIPPTWRPNKRERTQWEKLCQLPNVLYTNGVQWTQLCYGEPIAPMVRLDGSLTNPRDPLRPADRSFERLITRFLLWEPECPRSLTELIRVAAGLCRLLRDEVSAILAGSPRHIAYADLTLLAADWREFLFPGLDDDGFSDAYAQTVTFAMLLAQIDGISFDNTSLHEVARLLGKKHSLMGRALAVLTDGNTTDELRTIETLRRVIATIDWANFDDGRTDIFVELYERFLAAYDPTLRKQSGSYYTPQPIAAFMVDFVDEILRDRMDHLLGLAAEDVVIVDPAMGTGTFLVEVLRSIALTVDAKRGRGARPAWLRKAFQERLVGFEVQAAPYAVAELRLHEALRTRFETEIPRAERRFLTDALENPAEQQLRLPAVYRVFGESREEANRIKREVRVMVVIGNPPHVEGTRGRAPWVEERRAEQLTDGELVARPSLDEFRTPGQHRYESDLYGLPWCFWRWGLWKVFETHDEVPAGIVAFLTPSSFIRGRTFAGMREYLRRTCDDGWIIDLSPEGNRPPQETRLFGGAVGRQLCIAVFARHRPYDRNRSATVRMLTLTGTRSEKIQRLGDVTLNDENWATCSDEWQSPFLPVSDQVNWEGFPRLDDLMPWSSRGVTAGRTWVYSPDPEILERRWERFLLAGRRERRRLFVESRDRDVDRQVKPLPGFAGRRCSLANETERLVPPIRAGYRSFDRQWLIPDNRLLVMARPPLWAVRNDRQVYVTEQSNHPINSGPGLSFTGLIPDIHHYNARSGRVFPLYRGVDAPNLTPGLLDAIRELIDPQASAEDVLAYIAGVTAHNGYTRRFHAELQEPGVRVPLTGDSKLWTAATAVGRHVLWLHTFGERCVNETAGRPRGFEQLISAHGPRVLVAIPDDPDEMPDTISHDADRNVLRVGPGEIGPVSQAVYDYDVGGMRIVSHWFDYRRRRPRHKRRSSRLDDENCLTWSPSMTTELLEVLTALDRCVALEPQQGKILSQVCNGPLITRKDLADIGVLPVPAHATKPPAPLDSETPRLF